MNGYGEVEVQLHACLVWALDGSELSVSHPGCLIPGTLLVGGWMGSRAGLGAVERRKIFFPLSRISSDPSVLQSVG
jgi:hypothetical protein